MVQESKFNYPHFLKVHVTLIRFYKRPTLAPVSTNERISKKYTDLYPKKGEKWK